jgi:hypothetical protein
MQLFSELKPSYILQQDVIQTLYSITYNNSLMQMVELYKILILLSLNQK